MTTLFLALFSGGLLAAGMAVNARLASRVGALEGSFVNHVVGTVFALTLLLTLPFDFEYVAAGLRWYYFMGGVIGVLVVAAVNATIPILGLTAVNLLAIAGRLGSSLVMDHFGWMELSIRPLNAQRAAGVILVLVGSVLATRRVVRAA